MNSFFLEIDDMPPETQETVFDEILDRDVQKELENGQIINWSLEVSDQLNSRLYALWNRSAGDCLLDSILQATWGIFDRDNSLRRALSDSLHDCATQYKTFLKAFAVSLKLVKICSNYSCVI